MSEDNQTAHDGPVMTYESTPEPISEPAPQASSEPAQAAPAPEPAQTNEPTAEAAPEPSEAEPAAPKRGNKALQARFSELTAQREAERKGREEAEKRAEAALELVKQLGGDPNTATPAKPLSVEEIRQQERQRLQQEQATADFNRRANEIHAAGVKAFPDFSDNLGELQLVGLLDPDRPQFLAAVMEADAPEKVLNHLGQNTDEAVRIAGLSPIKQAAELAKLSVKLSAPAAPKPKPISQAPAPIEPIAGPTEKGFDPLDETIPIDAWVAEMDKRDAARRKREREQYR